MVSAHIFQKKIQCLNVIITLKQKLFLIYLFDKSQLKNCLAFFSKYYNTVMNKQCKHLVIHSNVLNITNISKRVGRYAAVIGFDFNQNLK